MVQHRAVRRVALHRGDTQRTRGVLNSGHRAPRRRPEAPSRDLGQLGQRRAHLHVVRVRVGVRVRVRVRVRLRVRVRVRGQVDPRQGRWRIEYYG